MTGEKKLTARTDGTTDQKYHVTGAGEHYTVSRPTPQSPRQNGGNTPTAHEGKKK